MRPTALTPVVGVAVALALLPLGSGAYAVRSATSARDGDRPIAVLPDAARWATDSEPDPSFGPRQRRAALRTATADRTGTAQTLGLGDRQTLVATDASRDVDGTQHVRYSRTYSGLPVVGGDLVVHESASGRVERTDWASDRSVAPASTTPRVPREKARGRHLREVVYAAGRTPVLAWQGRVRGTEDDGTPVDRLVYTDARTGARLAVHSEVMTDEPTDDPTDDPTDPPTDPPFDGVGTGHTLYSGDVPLPIYQQGADKFVLVDTTRGGLATFDKNGSTTDSAGVLVGSTTPEVGDGTESDRATVAADAQYGAAATWDFYRTAFGRNGIADDGRAALSRVHYGKDYDNAFWSNACFCMTYGDGKGPLGPMVAVDVAGHEMTHGVTSETANLDYSGDAGGLNESTSDVMGTMVEFSVGTEAEPGNYLIGEKVVRDSGAVLRRMDQPSVGCYSSRVATYEPHKAAGVGNHLFYLLAEGSGAKTIGGVGHESTTCDGVPVEGIGRDAAAQIWYRALTTYWVSTTTYPQAATGMVRAARDLYGAGSQVCTRTYFAWKAVGIVPGTSCSGTAVTGYGSNVVANPGFERGATSWAQSKHPARYPLVTKSDLGFSNSGDWYSLLPGYKTTHVDTVSQTLTVPSGEGALLRFYLLLGTTRDPRYKGVDNLRVRVTYGKKTRTVATYTNQQATDGVYERKLVDVSAYRGKKVRISFTTTSNRDKYYNVYLVDDVSVVGMVSTAKAAKTP